MKKKWMLFCLLAVVSVGNAYPGSRAPAAAQLVKVRYFDRTACSRLAIIIRGDFRYSTSSEGDSLRISLPGTTVSPSYEWARLKYWSGYVNSVSVNTSPSDSVVLAVHCKSNTVFRVERMVNDNGLFVEVQSDSSHVWSSDSASVRGASTDVHSRIILPVQTFSLNGLASGEKSDAGKETSDVARKDDPLPPTRGQWEELYDLARSYPMVLILASSTVSTGLLLFFLRRHAGKKQRVGGHRAASTFPEALSDGSESLLQRSAAPESAGPPEPLPTAPSHQETSMVGLAKKYGRGLGEINLSFALKARQGEQKWARTVREVEQGGDTADNKLRIAKELGVGKGEIDLAMMFHHLKSPQPLRKELA